MDCGSFEDRLDDFLEDGLSSDERRAVLAHVGLCTRCRGLLEIVRGDLDVAGIEEDEGAQPDAAQARWIEIPGAPGVPGAPDLVASIVARTSGPACGRVEEQL